MTLARTQRLTGKDVRYMVRKSKLVHGKVLTFFCIPQYPNRQYSQCSIHIPKKLHKSAVIRNKLKRAALSLLQEHYIATQKVKLTNSKSSWSVHFQKIFIIVNKKYLPTLTEQLAQSKEQFYPYRHRSCKQDIIRCLPS